VDCEDARLERSGRVVTVELRAATAADSEFCYQLHKAALGPYVAAIWGWDDQTQRASHARVFNPDRWQIITARGVDIGMIDVERRPDEIYLGRIEISPDYQGRGIGTSLVSALIAEASRNGQALALEVLSVNERAYALYERLGLVEVGRHGDNNVKIAMRYLPSSATEL
jgi:ribosomal protein S18 acetylase RimI-like enzyme